MVESMIAEYIPGNYFFPRTYVKSDAATGLLSTRQGNRLLAVPIVLLRSIHRSLQAEAGQAAPLALYTFGFGWGGTFYDRVRNELEAYYHTTIAQMGAMEFLINMRQLWAVHGLGLLTLDFRYRQQGLVLVTTENSTMATGSEVGTIAGSFPWHHLEAGFIAAWFSRWAGKDIRACAIDWGTNMPSHEHQTLSQSGEESLPYTQFLVGLPSKVEQAEQWVRQGERSVEILPKLTT